MALAFLDSPDAEFVDCLRTVNLRANFDLLKELGRGDFSRVVLLKRRDTGEMFAAKIVKFLSGDDGSSLNSSMKAREHFQFELTLAYFLSPCPNIIHTQSDAFRTRHHIVALMEPAMGGSLDMRLQDPNFQITEQRLKSVAIQLASAIQFIHERSLVHGDIKPENVLVMDSTMSVVKLGDFSRTRKVGSMIRYATTLLVKKNSASKEVSSSPDIDKQNIEVGASFLKFRSMAPPEVADLSPSDFYTAHPSQDVWGYGMVLFCLTIENFPSWKMCSMSDSLFSTFIATLNFDNYVNCASASSSLANINIAPLPSDDIAKKYARSVKMLTLSFKSLLRAILDLDAVHRVPIKIVRNFTLHNWLKDNTPVRRRKLSLSTWCDGNEKYECSLFDKIETRSSRFSRKAGILKQTGDRAQSLTELDIQEMSSTHPQAIANAESNSTIATVCSTGKSEDETMN